MKPPKKTPIERARDNFKDWPERTFNNPVEIDDFLRTWRSLSVWYRINVDNDSVEKNELAEALSMIRECIKLTAKEYAKRGIKSLARQISKLEFKKMKEESIGAEADFFLSVLISERRNLESASVERRAKK